MGNFGNSYAVGDSIWDFLFTLILKKFQRRPKDKFMILLADNISWDNREKETPWREYVSHYGAKLVSFSDKMSAVPTLHGLNIKS